MVESDLLWTRVLGAVERDLGHPLSETHPDERRQAVTLLVAAGAFELRESVRRAAALLGVSRYTIYGDLKRLGVATRGVGVDGAGVTTLPTGWP